MISLFVEMPVVGRKIAPAPRHAWSPRAGRQSGARLWRTKIIARREMLASALMRSRSSRVGSAVQQPFGIRCADRASKTLWQELSDGLKLDRSLDQEADLGVDEDLTFLGVRAQTRGEIDDVADRGIFEPALKPDAPKRRVPVSDTHRKTEFVAAVQPSARKLSKSVAHFERHFDRTDRRVGAR